MSWWIKLNTGKIAGELTPQAKYYKKELNQDDNQDKIWTCAIRWK